MTANLITRWPTWIDSPALATERVEAQLVRRARNQGLSWTEIAAQLGVSKQAVHKKYGGGGLLGLGSER